MRDEEILEVNPSTTVGYINVPLSRLFKGEVSSRYT
jgi:hypothetical protein